MISLKRLSNIWFLYIVFFSSSSFSTEIAAQNNWAKINLNDQEREFLARKKVIKKCVDPLWMPMEAIKDNQHIGIIADILDLVEQKIATPIQLVETNNWPESLDKLKSRNCDIVTSDTATGETPDWYIKTDAFIDQKIVYITRIETPFQLDFMLIKDKKIGIPAGYPIIPLIKEKYGKVNIVEVGSVDEGLLMVSRGELFAFADILSICSHSIQRQKLTNLKVAGHINISAPTVMAVRSDMPLLVDILNKAFASIDDATLNQFSANWIKLKYDTEIDRGELLEYLFLIVLFISGVLYWNRKLRLVNQKLDKANAELALLHETDALTKTKNRYFLKYQIPELVKLAKRNQLSLGVAMFDIDFFKRINDRYGHVFGDKCLVAFSDQITHDFKRDSDWVIRYGGEEFIVICIGMNEEAFVQKLESFRLSIESLLISGDSGEKASFTVSIGCVFNEQIKALWDESIIYEVDNALYQAKKSGRNQLVKKD